MLTFSPDSNVCGIVGIGGVLAGRVVPADRCGGDRSPD
jgi:hypothetical protein